MNPASDWVLFLGRFHPLLVHLPIGLVILLVFLDLLSRFPPFRKANESAGYILMLAVPSAVASAVAGWLLSQAGGYDPQLLQRHQWAGVATAVLCVAVAGFRAGGWRQAYTVGLWLCAVVLAIASHLGGSLTHGSNYLTQYAPEPFRSWLAPSPPVESASAIPAGDGEVGRTFEQVVQPFLRTYCTECHQAEKRKGGLRLDSFEHVLAGGDSGPAIVLGQADASLLLQRVRLPLDHEERMPPAGKPQPPSETVEVLSRWIDRAAATQSPGP